MWFCIELGTTEGQLDLLTGRLAEMGHPASEVLEETAEAPTLRLYIEEAGLGSARACHQRLVEELGPAIRRTSEPQPVEETVWTENWKQHFTPLLIGKRLAVLAPWHDAVAEAAGKTVVVIDPGLAFGTGHHETTRSCLEMVERYCTEGLSVADIGCGSGILAIAALKLGAGRALATETDPVALDVTRRNAVINGVAERLDLEAADAAGPRGCFDLVLANIVAGTLVELAPQLTACLAPGGHLVLSGIESDGASLVKGAVSRSGLRCLEELDRDSWITLVMEANGD